MTDSDLVINLRWRHPDESFDVSAEYDQPDNVDERRVLGSSQVALDPTELDISWLDEEAYGQMLTKALFESPEIDGIYRSAVQDLDREADLSLHFRLFIDPGAPPEYQRIRWESLRDPLDDAPIARGRRVLFSRYLDSWDWRAPHQRPKRRWKALIAVATPSDLGQYEPEGRVLSPLDRQGEAGRARAALVRAGAEVVELVEPGEATLRNIVEALDTGFDIFYLVCHGAISDNAPRLYLESGDGMADVVDAHRLSSCLSGLRQRPTLAVLCSCQSAGPGDPAAPQATGLSAVGPLMSRQGIPAVLAMHGNLSMDTADLFFSEFFHALATTDAVDLAVASARDKIGHRFDWWVPVLFSRLRTGRPWYRTDFDRESTAKWISLRTKLEQKLCTPVVGPDLSHTLIGSRRDIAREFVDRFQMPISPHGSGDFAKVAQYLRVNTGEDIPASQLVHYIKTVTRKRLSDEDPSTLTMTLTVEEMLARGGALARQDASDPYRMLSRLDLPVYVSTGWTSLLKDALEADGKTVREEMFDWRSQRPDEPERMDEPKPESPLVYYLFGKLTEPDTLVLSEDDYFVWYERWINRRDRYLPTPVKTALARRSLLFLGYRLDDWDFRVVFQSIKTFGAGLASTLHVGVQADPESQILEHDAAQKYLNSLLGQDSVHVFWGDARQFLEKMVNTTVGGP